MEAIGQIGLWLLVMIGALVAAAWFSGGIFRSNDVCLRCGAERTTNRVLWIPFSEVRATPLSSYLQIHGRPATEGHRWALIGGSGGPIRCALGNGRRLARVVRNKDVPKILENIRTHRGDAAADKWTNRLLGLTKDRGMNAYLAVFLLSDPATDFDSAYATAAEDYDLWLSDPAH